jgi:Amt family ammonium transporter
MRGVLEQPVPGANNKQPRITYAMYQLTFAALVPAIAIGAACERGRVGPTMLFVFCWATLVYCPM